MDPTLVALQVFALFALFVIYDRYRKNTDPLAGCRKVGSKVVCDPKDDAFDPNRVCHEYNPALGRMMITLCDD